MTVLSSLAKDIGLAIVWILVPSIVAGLVLGIDLDTANWLSTFGTPPDLSVAQHSIGTSQHDLTSVFIEAYNTALPSTMRFGSGLGIIGGAFWGMGRAKGKSAVVRIIAGALAGIIIGGRCAMMITSSANVVVFVAVFGMIAAAVYVYLAGGPPRFHPLPKTKLAQ